MYKLKDITKVFVFESPSPNELLLGINEGKDLTESFNKLGIQNELFNINNLSELIESLRIAGNDVKKKQKDFGMVHLHFSMHGSEEGISLNSGEFLNWQDLQKVIKDFNQIVGYIEINGKKILPTTLCFSVCKAINAKKIKEYDDKPVYMGLIAPSKDVTWADSLLAFSQFYQYTIIKEKPVNYTIDLINKNLGKPGLFCLDNGL